MTAVSPPARRLSAQKSAQIVEAAKSVFLREGFGPASMDVIAAQAGVSKMTVYRHFESKDVLFAAVIQELCAQIIDGKMVKLLALPPAEALPLLAHKMVEILYAPETIELHRIVVAESRNFPQIGRLFYESGPQACIELLVTYFEQHLNGDRSAAALRQDAEDFLETVRGYPHLRVLLGLDKAPSRRDMKVRIDRAVDTVLARHGALGRPQTSNERALRLLRD